MQVAQSFCGLTTTVSPSHATVSSVGSMPLDAHSSISVSRIVRDASEMSVSPLQNFWKPPPVPETPTVTWVPRLAIMNSSAIAWLIGNTVLDPSIATEPERPPSPSSPPPHATNEIVVPASSSV